MSNATKSGCLGYIGDYATLFLWGVLRKPLLGIPIDQPVQWKVEGFFFPWLSVGAPLHLPTPHGVEPTGR